MNNPTNLRFYLKFRKFLIQINKDLFLIKRYIEDTPNIPPSELYYYVIALEDRAFTRHCGIHFKSIIREVLKYISFQQHGGASTIDMQMVRTITGFKDRTLYRKIYEMILAYIINFKYSKLQIINCYLYNAFFGSHLYGIDKTIKSVFKKYSLAMLTDFEQAILASMLQKPRPINPSYNWQSSITKRARYAQLIRRIYIKNTLN